eukprot:c16314_g1_i1 orf=81-1445(+)
MASTPVMASSSLLKPSSAFCVAFLLLLISPLNLVSARPGKSCHGFFTAFSFSDFSADVQKLELLGDAKVLGSGLQIAGSSPLSAGGFFYSEPLRFSSAFRKGESKSFSTFFSFSMDANKGDGLAFVIAPSKALHGRNGAWLGLSDESSQLAHMVVIEFDTFMDAEVQDPSGNHVGFDIESMVSLATAEVSDGFSLKDGEKLYAWIDYIAPAKVLEVRLSRSEAQRPVLPLLSYKIDLANVWKEEMFVGFSSSTGNSPQKHVVYSWSFATRELGMGKQFPGFRPGFFGPRGGDHGHGDWHHGPRDFHRGPHDWHHGPRDWHHGPGDWPHGHDGWRHEGFPYWPAHDMPNEWHPDHFHPQRVDDDDSWFDGLNDVWGVVISLLFGAVCGTAAAGAILVVWSFIRRCYMRDASDAEEEAGILFGYQKLTVPAVDAKVNANGYQKVSTTEPDGKTETA